MELRDITRANTTAEEFETKRRFFAANSIGGYPFVGTPDKIAEELAVAANAGVKGIAFSFVNYNDELPYFRDEVLPRLARMGLRKAP
jgi:alkanesulfonate monooxygenase SsuD/methylene tetrahydromethanopterin reductase-like flavin-dependent oxidoreductase (luciferase family)